MEEPDLAAWQEHVVERVFPGLVQGILRGEGSDRASAARATGANRLERAREGALGWLERLLLLCYADARGKLPAPSGGRRGESFRKLLKELARIGGDKSDELEERISVAYAGGEARLGDRLRRLLGPLERLFLADAVCVPDACLTRAIDGLSRIWLDRGEPPQEVDYRRRTMRDWGTVYERLLETRVESEGPSRRKTGGCFYTPQAIVAEIVEHSVGAILDAKLAALERELDRSGSHGAGSRESLDCCFDFRVLDPSSGAGYFLAEAARVIRDRISAFLAKFPDRERRTKNGGGKVSCDASWIERQIVERCLFGIDVDLRAVELARIQLWLESPLELESLDALVRHVRLGDALAEPALAEFPGAGEYDAVVGNPPHGAKLDAASRRALALQLPLMKSNSDTAVGFIERAAQWIGPAGRAGLVVPKPLTYSYAWRGVREFLHRRIERLIDVGRAWPEVRLEQAIVVFRGAAANAPYRSGWISSGRIVAGSRMSWALAERFQTLPCALVPAELERAARLEFSETSIGDVCRTFRGIPAQRRLANRGETAVVGGRDLARWHVRSVSGYLQAPEEFDLRPFAREKLMFQNIIAHAARPAPHVKLIGAYDSRRTVALDTVNNLVAVDPQVELRGLCALLHSKLVNWLVYSLIYNKAIRTMHFDQYFLNKIPLPPEWPELLARLAALAKECEAAADAMPVVGRLRPLRRDDARRAEALADQRRQALEEIDRLVAAAYRDSQESSPS